jgi:hypothetical protein
MPDEECHVVRPGSCTWSLATAVSLKEQSMRLSGLAGRSLIVCALLGAPGFAFAAPFTNGSFELGPNPGSFITLGAGNTQIAGWLVSAGNIDYIGSLWQHADGSRSLDMNGSTAGAVSQTFDTNAGAQYEVRFAMAGNPAG